MPSEDSDGETESGNGEDGVQSYKQKYRILKARLKYLIYEHESFETDIQKSQRKLLQLSREKSFLLDRLMRYETVVLSEDDGTDFSSEEDEGGSSLVAALATNSQGTETPKSQPSQHATPVPRAVPQPPSSTTPAHSTRRTEPGVGDGTAVGVAKTAAGLSPKGGPKKQSKTTATVVPLVVGNVGGSGGGVGDGGNGGFGNAMGGKKISATAAAKISKTLSRQHPSLHVVASLPPGPQPPALPPLVVSLPLNLAGKTPQKPSHALKPQVQVALKPVWPSAPVSLAGPATQGLASGVLTSSGRPVSSSSSAGSSSSSSSGSSSDSDDSPSDSNTSSDEDEPMDTGPQGPVPMVTTIANTKVGGGQLLRPKAITSPIKVPSQVLSAGDGSVSATPPAVLSPLASPRGQPGGFSWTNRPKETAGSPSSLGGFVPIAPPLSSPPSSVPFPSLSKHSSGSAFHVVGPKPPSLISDASKKPPT